MPSWKPLYKSRRSTNILSFSIRNNNSLLEIGGESCYLLKRFDRANVPPTQRPDRAVSTITRIASSYDIDSDTGLLRYKLWGRTTHINTEYPDIKVFTCTVQSSGSTDVFDYAIDKYSFINALGYKEYTFDIYQDRLDTNGFAMEDAVYLVFGPAMNASNIATFTFGTISPMVKFEGDQPVRDTEVPFYNSLFGFQQWINNDSRVRSIKKPHAFLLAFPTVESDIKMTEGGFLQFSEVRHWTNPPMIGKNGYPKIVEFDIIVRGLNGERYQVVNYTPIYIEDIIVQQQFNLVELDPRSMAYQIPVLTVKV